MNDSRSIWGLRLLALFLALLVWFFVSLQRRERLSDTVLEANVRYANFPGLVALDPVETVRVTVRGPVSQMRHLNPFQVDIFVDLDSPAKGIFEVPLTAENVFLPEGLELVSIEPNLIRVELDREQDHLLGVRPRLVGEPAAGAVVLDPEVIPALVLVRGPESRIAQASFLSTTPVDLTGHAIDFEQQAAVLSSDPLIKVVQPRIVTVRIPLQIPGAAQGGE